MVIAVKANNVQPTLMPAAMLFDSECEVGDVDDAGNADVGVDAILVELKAVNVAARVEDVRTDKVEDEKVLANEVEVENVLADDVESEPGSETTLPS